MKAGRAAQVFRISVWLLMLTAGSVGLVRGQDAPKPAPVYVVDIDSVINPGSSGLLQHAIETAEEQKAAALILRLNTPGGLLSSTRDMVKTISKSQVPVIGYVGPSGASATSAGAFILLATHVATMNSGTNVGASSPVSGEGADIGGTLGKKIMNDSRAFMRSVANSRNRNADVAERFVSEAKSLTASEALDEGVIDLVVPEFPSLIKALHGRQVEFHGETLTLDVASSEIREVEPRLLDRLLKIIAHPQIAHLLISLGMLAIYVEIMSPGLAFPGVFGVIAVILGLIGVQTLPVNLGFLLLLFLGLVLMAVELFVAGFGVLGIGGAAAFIFGSFFLFDVPLSAEYRNTMIAVSVAVSAVMVLTSFLVTRSFKAGSRLTSVVGKTGEAMVNFDKRGHVLVEDQRWPADTLEPLHHGDAVTIVAEQSDGRVLVKKSPSEK